MRCYSYHAFKFIACTYTRDHGYKQHTDTYQNIQAVLQVDQAVRSPQNTHKNI